MQKRAMLKDTARRPRDVNLGKSFVKHQT